MGNLPATPSDWKFSLTCAPRRYKTQNLCNGEIQCKALSYGGSPKEGLNSSFPLQNLFPGKLRLPITTEVTRICMLNKTTETQDLVLQL